MEFAEAKTKVVELRAELIQVDAELKELNKIYIEHRKKVTLCENKKKDLSKEIKKLEDIIEAEDIYTNVLWIEGFETLSQHELVAITNGMNKTDYREYGSRYPRWLDLERIVKEVIEFKKLYSGWILERLASGGQQDSLPPYTFYRYTYKTPQGHFMSFGGIEVLS